MPSNIVELHSLILSHANHWFIYLFRNSFMANSLSLILYCDFLGQGLYLIFYIIPGVWHGTGHKRAQHTSRE